MIYLTSENADVHLKKFFNLTDSILKSLKFEYGDDTQEPTVYLTLESRILEESSSELWASVDIIISGVHDSSVKLIYNQSNQIISDGITIFEANNMIYLSVNNSGSIVKTIENIKYSNIFFSGNSIELRYKVME